jgi:acetyltransferase EpsM
MGQERFGIKIYDRKAFSNFSDAKVLAVNGSPSSYLQRGNIINTLALSVERFATVIHPNASVSAFAHVGVNVLLMAGVVVTANAIVQDHVTILPNSVIHHDSEIGLYTLIAANVTIAGNVVIGKNCYVGAASSVKNGVSVPASSLIGMGANVVRSYSESVVLVGNPARPMYVAKS